MATKKSRIMTASEFVAESLETLAKTKTADEAGFLREAAAKYRAVKDRRTVSVSDKNEDFSQAAARIVREATKE
jgi:hypothetical protein